MYTTQNIIPILLQYTRSRHDDGIGLFGFSVFSLCADRRTPPSPPPPPHVLFVVVVVIDHILGSNRARSSHGLFVIKRDRPSSYDEKIHVLLQYITRTHGFFFTRFALLFYSFLFSSPFPCLISIAPMLVSRCMRAGYGLSRVCT